MERLGLVPFFIATASLRVEYVLLRFVEIAWVLGALALTHLGDGHVLRLRGSHSFAHRSRFDRRRAAD